MSEHYDAKTLLRDIVPFGIAAAALLVGILSNNLGVPLTMRALGFVMVVAALSIVVSACVSRALVGSRYRHDIKAVDAQTAAELKQMREYVAAFGSLLAQGRILTDEYIAQLEANIPDNSEVWIVSPNLHKDVPTAGEYCFERVVRDNITKRNVRYTYLVPDEPLQRQRAVRMRNAFPKEHQDKVLIVPLKTDLWERLPYRGSDLAIYNPLQTNNQATEVVFELPTGKRDQWVKADEVLTSAWSREISRVLDDRASPQNLVGEDPTRDDVRSKMLPGSGSRHKSSKTEPSNSNRLRK